MKLIDYDKYSKKWSPRATILLLVVESVVTGFLLSWSLIGIVRGHDVWSWAFPLVLGFSSGVGALQATLIALHNCPPSVRKPQNETVPHNAGI